MATKTLIDLARSAENPRDVLLDEAHRIIHAVMDGRIDIKRVKAYIEAEEEIRNLPIGDFFEALDKNRQNRRQWGIPRD